MTVAIEHSMVKEDPVPVYARLPKTLQQIPVDTDIILVIQQPELLPKTQQDLEAHQKAMNLVLEMNSTMMVEVSLYKGLLHQATLLLYEGTDARPGPPALQTPVGLLN